MKRALLLMALLFLLALFGLVLVLRPPHKPIPPLPLSLTMPTSIQVGEALTIIAHTQANTSVSFTLFNGIQRLAKTLNSDGDGSAAWDIPADTVTSAGDSLIIAHALSDTVRQGLHVLSGDVSQLDFLTTSNNLTAYGESQTMLIALAGDRYGNPVSSDNLDLSAQFPGVNPQTSTLSTEAGLGWGWLRSAGIPGRVRLALSAGKIEQTLELAQMPSAPASVTLKLVPACVPDDGRSLITLQAQVADQHGSPIANSTIVQFEWYQGSGSAQVYNGMASLRVPAPAAAGRYSFKASSGSAISLPALLQVQPEGCT